jgi:hypothetical protein
MNVDRTFWPVCLAGALIGQNEGQITFGGSCFALWHEGYAITAAHCCKGADLIGVCWGFQTPVREIVAVELHPEADLAVLRLKPGGPAAPAPPYAGIGEWPAEGADHVGAFGWATAHAPEEAVPAAGLVAGPVLDAGALSPWNGYRSAGVEFGARVARGTSGGPVFLVADQTLVLGLVSQGPDPGRLTADTITRPGGATITLPVIVGQGPARSFAARLDVYEPWLRERIAA